MRPDPESPTDAAGERAVLAATRELLWIEGAGDARAAAVGLVESLGGTVVPAARADYDALPVDVSFGDGEPLLPTAPSVSPAHMLLARHLPGFVRDAHRAVALARRSERLVEDADTDPLSGLASRRVLGRALGRLASDDVVVMLDLDHFKALNDDYGHAEGDRVLRAFGLALGRSVRARDLAARYGGEEFVVILSAVDGPADPEAFLARLRSTWEQQRPRPVTFSAGIAPADDGAMSAMERVDAALYRAKGAGRDRWAWADHDEGQSPTHDPGVAVEVARGDGGFVAHSRLAVPDGGREALVEAFRARLRLVEDWPGFQRLEVWGERRDPTAFAMVSWWDSEAAFRAYMASEDHRRSHARIPSGELRPRPDAFRSYDVVAR